MRCVIIVAVAALALARPHPRPRVHNDVARSMEREKRAEINDALKEKTATHFAWKKHHSNEHPKPVDPVEAEKIREAAERDAAAAAAEKKKSAALKKELEKKRLEQEKVANDMKQMHTALDDSTKTTTTVAPSDTYVSDTPDVPQPKAEPAPPTPAQLAKIAQEKIEQQERAREAEEDEKKKDEAAKKAQAKAQRIKNEQNRLHSDVQALKAESKKVHSSDSSAIKKDEAEVSKIEQDIGHIVAPAVAIAKPIELAPPEKKVELPKAVQEADEEAHRLLKTKTHSLSKGALRRTEEEIKKEARSTAASLHAAARDAQEKEVAADLKHEEEEEKEVRAAQKKAIKEIKEDAEDQKKMMHVERPHRMFRPKKYDPKSKSPEQVAHQILDEEGRREGALQNKMKDMMGSMEKVREQIGHDQDEKPGTSPGAADLPQ